MNRRPPATPTRVPPTSARRPGPAARPRRGGATAATPRWRPWKVGLFAGLVLLCLVSVLAPLSAYVRQQSELAALSADVEQGQDRVDALSGQVERWQDPAYVSAQARARLQFVMPGETGYVVLDAPPDPAEQRERAALTTPGPSQPWYEALWETVSGTGDEQR